MGIVLSVILGAATLGADSPCIPTGQALTAAQASVETVFGNDIRAAVTPGTKSGLAGRMLKVAGEEKDSSLRYAILQRARELAVDAGDPPLGFEITKAIAIFATPGAGKLDGWTWINEGDRLREEAKDEASRRDRLRTLLFAAECYLKAEPNPTGLTKEFIAKKVAELASDVVGKKNADLLILPGKWDVQATNGYRGTWTFSPDGTVSNGHEAGAWRADQRCVRITWNKEAWETFHRPLNATGTSGDSWHGAGIVRATKVAD